MSTRIRTALIVIGLLAALALLAPWLSPYSHDHIDWEQQAVPPQLEAAHWLGTDRLGRDLFARSMQG
jgi:ABC-type dipeptide/oligopeptide/nickel transport system permease subunit